MRLIEAVMNANQGRQTGDSPASLPGAEVGESLPIAVLTCIDPRLNSLVPRVLGVGSEDLVWLRNAGNIITGPLSSTMRSLALACALRTVKEIAILGHTDCLVRRTTVLELTDHFKAMGLERSRLPDNLNEYFGLFASERQNVIKAVDLARQSPLIGPKIPVHGLLVDTTTGKLEWLVNGYETMANARLQTVVDQSVANAANEISSAAQVPASPMVGGLTPILYPEGNLGYDPGKRPNAPQVPLPSQPPVLPGVPPKTPPGQKPAPLTHARTFAPPRVGK